MQVPPKRAGLFVRRPPLPKTISGLRVSTRCLPATVMARQADGSWNGMAMMDLFTNGRRILSVWLPRLPTDRLRRKNGGGPDKPLVVSIKSDNALRIYAADRRAA